jgi:cell division FtsZ-interacting protein ZapD
MCLYTRTTCHVACADCCWHLCVCMCAAAALTTDDAGGEGHLESELAKLRDQQERTEQELQQQRVVGGRVQAALQQLQTAMQAVVSVSGELAH